MALSCPTKPLAELRLHPALDFLGRDIDTFAGELQISVNDLCPMVHPVLFTTRWHDVVGNWPAYCEACRQSSGEVPVMRLLDLAWDEPDIATMRALTSVCRPRRPDPLLLGLVFRHWRRHEDVHVPLRANDKINQLHYNDYGMTYRDHLHRELTRRLGRSLRELQRLASVLDAPPAWLRLHRQGRVSLQVLERVLMLSAADQDDLTDELQQGAVVDDLIRDYGLRVERRDRRIQSTLGSLLRSVQDVVERIEPHVAERPGVTETIIGDLEPAQTRASAGSKEPSNSTTTAGVKQLTAAEQSTTVERNEFGLTDAEEEDLMHWVYRTESNGRTPIASANLDDALPELPAL